MKEYFLCSSEVIKHFPDLVKSKPFRSSASDGYEIHYIIEILSDAEISNYYDHVIEPYNNQTKGDYINFWTRPCEESFVDAAPKGCLTKCRRDGVFSTIEMIYDFTTMKNVAFSIYKMAQYYGLNPIEFINKVTK